MFKPCQNISPSPVKLGQRPVYSGVTAQTKDHVEMLSFLERAGSFAGKGVRIFPGCKYGVSNLVTSMRADAGALNEKVASVVSPELLDDKTRAAMQGWFRAKARMEQCLKSNVPVSPGFTRELFKTARHKNCEPWLLGCVSAVSDDHAKLMEFINTKVLTEDDIQKLDDLVRQRADGSFREENYRAFLDTRDPANKDYTVLQKLLCSTRSLPHINAILKTGVELPSPEEDQNGPEAMALAVKDEHIALKLIAQRHYQQAKKEQSGNGEVPCVIATYQFDESEESRVEAERQAYQALKNNEDAKNVNAVLIVCRTRDRKVESWLVHASCYPLNPRIIPISQKQCPIDPAAAARHHWEQEQKGGQVSLWEQLPQRMMRAGVYGAGALAVCWASGSPLLLPALIGAGVFLERNHREARVSKGAAGLTGLAIGGCLGQPVGGYVLGSTIGQAADYYSNSMAKAVGEELGESEGSLYVLTTIGGTFWLVNEEYLGLAESLGTGLLSAGMLRKNPKRTLVLGGLTLATWYVMTANQIEIGILDTPEQIAGLMAAAGVFMGHNLQPGRVLKTVTGLKNLVVRACSDVADRGTTIRAGTKRTRDTTETVTGNAEKKPRLETETTLTTNTKPAVSAASDTQYSVQSGSWYSRPGWPGESVSHYGTNVTEMTDVQSEASQDNNLETETVYSGFFQCSKPALNNPLKGQELEEERMYFLNKRGNSKKRRVPKGRQQSREASNAESSQKVN